MERETVTEALVNVPAEGRALMFLEKDLERFVEVAPEGTDWREWVRSIVFSVVDSRRKGFGLIGPGGTLRIAFADGEVRVLAKAFGIGLPADVLGELQRRKVGRLIGRQFVSYVEFLMVTGQDMSVLEEGGEDECESGSLEAG